MNRGHRIYLFDKQKGKCFYCEEQIPFRHWTVDHIVPRSKGGKNSLDNYLGACDECNVIRGTMDVKTFKFIRYKPKKTRMAKRFNPKAKNWRARMVDEPYPGILLLLQGLKMVYQHKMTWREFASYTYYAEWRPRVLKLLNPFFKRLMRN